MSNPLLAFLGALLIQPAFREAVLANPKEALKSYGITFSRREHQIAAKMVASLRGGHLDDAIAVFQNADADAPCPVWPCNDLYLVPFDAAASFYSSGV